MLRRSLLSLLVVPLVLACNDATSPDAGLEGTWTLQTVGGKPLPYTLPEDGPVKFDVTAETITLLASGRLNMATTFRVTDGSRVFPETVPDSGTYVANGSTVTFTYHSDGSTDVATVNGKTMTISDVNITWVYRRE